MASVVRSPTDPWPTDEQWLTMLPAWFVEVSLDETAAGLPPLPAESDGADVERWSVDAFVHWFEPSEREWWWWGIESESEDTLTVCLAVEEYTVFHAALDWLLYASGAAVVEDENLRELREARGS